VSPVSKSESRGCLFFSGTPGPTPGCFRGRQVGKKLKKHNLCDLDFNNEKFVLAKVLPGKFPSEQ
jgi:hypothetical protein